MWFDCIVVGAGPAGATAAYHLVRNGYSVLLLEKESLPRYKPCGGGVCPQVQQYFDFDLSPAVSAHVFQARCTLNASDPVDLDLSPEGLWMVRREQFDYLIVLNALRAGAELLEATLVTGATKIEEGWQIQTSAGDFEGAYVVAADGAKGPMAKLLGFPERKFQMAGAIEAELPVEQNSDDLLHLEFGGLQNGYLWNFPKSDGRSIGAGAMRSGARQSLRGAMCDYIDRFGLDPESASVHGHPILTWDGHQDLHGYRSLLAGEAACLVDPLTAEGIRPAIFSGFRAAEAISRSLQGEERALVEYTNTIKHEHGVDMLWASRLSKLFYGLAPMTYQLMIKPETMNRRLADVAVGKLRYRDIGRSMLAAISLR